ncbi:hypothetical protein FACS1894120_6410 [Clostridia bacterium]|nr:hypothetical protein FACS1894120_6410 [Clostridia bacterium]
MNESEKKSLRMIVEAARRTDDGWVSYVSLSQFQNMVQRIGGKLEQMGFIERSRVFGPNKDTISCHVLEMAFDWLDGIEQEEGSKKKKRDDGSGEFKS